LVSFSSSLVDKNRFLVAAEEDVGGAATREDDPSTTRSGEDAPPRELLPPPNMPEKKLNTPPSAALDAAPCFSSAVETPGALAGLVPSMLELEEAAGVFAVTELVFAVTLAVAVVLVVELVLFADAVAVLVAASWATTTLRPPGEFDAPRPPGEFDAPRLPGDGSLGRLFTLLGGRAGGGLALVVDGGRRKGERLGGGERLAVLLPGGELTNTGEEA